VPWTNSPLQFFFAGSGEEVLQSPAYAASKPSGKHALHLVVEGEVGRGALSLCAGNAWWPHGHTHKKTGPAVTSLLPHGGVRADMVAKKLGMSERTLARRLAEEGVTFIEIVQQLKSTLARYYLEDTTMPISQIAWLLGFEEPSSFSHACKRWTGKTPREMRGADLAVV
jgi:AraC-like DNA-binding protein